MAHQLSARLRRGIGRARLQRGVLRRRLPGGNVAVDLVGAHLEQSQPIGPGRFQQRHDADHVRPGKCPGIEQRAIDVRFGGEVDDGVDVRGDLPDEIGIGDVALNEAEAWIVAHLVQIRQVPGIGQQVETKDLVVGLLAQHVPHVGGTDESGGAGDQNAHVYYPPTDARPLAPRQELGREHRNILPHGLAPIPKRDPQCRRAQIAQRTVGRASRRQRKPLQKRLGRDRPSPAPDRTRRASRSRAPA